MEKIVIIGGGAGGLELASNLGRSLGRKKLAEIVLVDRYRRHLWKPLLHEVATGSIDPSTQGLAYHAHAAANGFRFVLGELAEVDPKNKTLLLAAQIDATGKQTAPARASSYDQLVLAIGSVSNDFGTQGVAEHCYFLDSHRQAERFHGDLLNQVTRLNQDTATDELKIAIVGGGATGVELSAELEHVAGLLGSLGFQSLAPSQFQITLIEAGNRILPALPERLADSVRRELEEHNVTVREGLRVVEANASGFITDSGERIDAHMMIWAAGVKAPEAIANIEDLEHSRGGQVVVNSYLQAKGFDDVWVLGDCAAAVDSKGVNVPPRAQAAHQMATVVANNIKAQRQGKTLKAFTYTDHGSLINLSNFSTVGSLMGNIGRDSWFIEGKFARLMYWSLYRMHLSAVYGPVRMVIRTLIEWLSKGLQPKIKLH